MEVEQPPSPPAAPSLLCLQVLLELGADVNATTTRVEESALLYATRRGHEGCARLLVQVRVTGGTEGGTHGVTQRYRRCTG